MPPDAAPLVQQLLAFSSDRETIAAVNALFGVDAVFVARLTDDRRPEDPVWAAERPLLEVRLLGGSESDGVFILANQLRLEGEVGVWRWNARAAGPWALLLALVAWPFVRGWGSVVVKLDYDTKATRGFFHVRLSRLPGKASAAREKDGESNLKRYQGKVRVWSRFARAMADSETRFRLVPARVWYVHVHGLLTDAKSKEVIGSCVEERADQSRARTVAGRGLQPAARAGADRGTPHPRRRRGGGRQPPGRRRPRGARRDAPLPARGTALLHVGNGTHRVVVGLEDRVFEQEVTVAQSDRRERLLPGRARRPRRLHRLPRRRRAVPPRRPPDREPGARPRRADGARESAPGRVPQGARREREGRAATTRPPGAWRKPPSSPPRERTRAAGDALRAGRRLRARRRGLPRVGRPRARSRAVRGGLRLRRRDRLLQARRRRRRARSSSSRRPGATSRPASSRSSAGENDRAIRNLQKVDLRDPDYDEACRLLADLVGGADDARPRRREARRRPVAASGDDGCGALELLEQSGDLPRASRPPERALEALRGDRRKRDGASSARTRR